MYFQIFWKPASSHLIHYKCYWNINSCKVVAVELLLHLMEIQASKVKISISSNCNSSFHCAPRLSSSICCLLTKAWVMGRRPLRYCSIFREPLNESRFVGMHCISISLIDYWIIFFVFIITDRRSGGAYKGKLFFLRFFFSSSYRKWYKCLTTHRLFILL